MGSPIFITARFRTGSTLLWNVFRHIKKTEAFYEPLHEDLLQMVNMRLPPQPEHYHVQNYLDNYPPGGELAKYHDSEFGVCRLHLEADDHHPRLKDYLAYLIDKVNANRIPVLQCNRIDFRLPWIKANFPGALIIHLYRSARDQWVSSVARNPQFEESDVDADPFLITTWARDLCDKFPFLSRPFIRHAYQRFYYLWKLSYLIGYRQADLSVSYEDLLSDTKAVLKLILSTAGVEPRNLIDVCSGLVVSQPATVRASIEDEKWFQDIEDECERTLTELSLNQQYGTRKLAEIIDGNSQFQDQHEVDRNKRWALHNAQLAIVVLKNNLKEKEKVIAYLRSTAKRTQAERASSPETGADIASAPTMLRGSDYSLAVDTMRTSVLLGLPVACMNHLFVYRLRLMLRRSYHSKTARNLMGSLLQLIKTFLWRWLIPRVGRLHQHPSIPLQIPPHYFVTDSPTDRDLTVSIVTPSLNQAKYLERTVRSVIAQNYPKLEYVIQDGGSTDGTKLVLERLGPLVHHIETCKDRGQAHAINLGFTHTTGEIMAWLNSDDILLPGALNYIAEIFLNNPNVDVVYSHRILIDEEGWEIGRWILPKHECEVLKWADFIPQETLFWRRSIWERAGGRVDETLQYAMDWEMLLRFKLSGAKFMRVPRFLGAFRVHRAQKTLSLFEKIGLAEVNLLRERYHGQVPSNNEIQSHISSYLTRSVIYDNLYRLGVLRY